MLRVKLDWKNNFPSILMRVQNQDSPSPLSEKILLELQGPLSRALPYSV